MHETGDGAPQDYAKAAEYYDQACTAGREESCAHLAMMYDIGLAVHEDPVRAVELYDKACKAGNSWACNREQELK
jgi:TPR repeat protein